MVRTLMTALRFSFDPIRSCLWVDVCSSLLPIKTQTRGLRGWVDLALLPDGMVNLDVPVRGRLEISVDRLVVGQPALRPRVAGGAFDARRHPLIIGQITGVHATEIDGRYRVTGDLSFHGKTRVFEHEMTIALDGELTIELKGDRVFDIREFGMKPPSMLMLKVYPEVAVRVELYGSREHDGVARTGRLLGQRRIPARRRPGDEPRPSTLSYWAEGRPRQTTAQAAIARSLIGLDDASRRPGRVLPVGSPTAAHVRLARRRLRRSRSSEPRLGAFLVRVATGHPEAQGLHFLRDQRMRTGSTASSASTPRCTPSACMEVRPTWPGRHHPEPASASAANAAAMLAAGTTTRPSRLALRTDGSAPLEMASPGTRGTRPGNPWRRDWARGLTPSAAGPHVAVGGRPTATPPEVVAQHREDGGHDGRPHTAEVRHMVAGPLHTRPSVPES